MPGTKLRRNIVERHGGQITARSADEGRGPTFGITLPCQTAIRPGPSLEPFTIPEQTSTPLLA